MFWNYNIWSKTVLQSINQYDCTLSSDSTYFLFLARTTFIVETHNHQFTKIGSIKLGQGHKFSLPRWSRRHAFDRPLHNILSSSQIFFSYVKWWQRKSFKIIFLLYPDIFHYFNAVVYSLYNLLISRNHINVKHILMWIEHAHTVN